MLSTLEALVCGDGVSTCERLLVVDLTHDLLVDIADAPEDNGQNVRDGRSGRYLKNKIVVQYICDHLLVEFLDVWALI
jgi:hypothetical protein